jgi:hypothetical protein
MSPIFVRRGNVLFLLKTPSDFIRKLKSGKIRPTDSLFVQNGGVSEWLPISEIREFQQDSTPIYEQQAVRREDDLLDHLVEPGFNLEAFFKGPCWYFRRGMYRIGAFWLLLFATGMLILPVLVYWLGGTLITSLLIGGLGWSASAAGSAWTADRVFNRHQIERSGYRSAQITDRIRPEYSIEDLEFDPIGSQFFETKKDLLN